MKRFWISFYSGYYEKDGCTKPPFQIWISGYRGDDCTICALVEAKNEKEIWKTVKKHFPDYEERFIEETEKDWVPGDRFPDFEGKVSLT